MWRGFGKLLKHSIVFDPLKQAIAEEQVSSGNRVMGYIKENGDIVLKETKTAPACKEMKAKTGTHNL